MSIFQPFSSHPSFSDVFSLFFPRGCSSLCWSSVCPQGPRAELGGFSLKISFSATTHKDWVSTGKSRLIFKLKMKKICYKHPHRHTCGARGICFHL